MNWTKSKWWIALLSLVAVALVAVGGNALVAQDAGKAGAKKEAQAERFAMFKKAYPLAKVSLSTALASVEKESKTRAHSVEYTLTKDGKLTIEVGLVVNDKFTAMFVDPDSGKIEAPKQEEEENGEEGEEEEEEGG